MNDGSFDLLLALFADGIVSSCNRYLTTGGDLIANNHRGEVASAIRDGRLSLKASVRFRKGKYLVAEENADKVEISAGKSNSRYLTDQGTRYVESETYFIFQRLH